MDKVKQTLETFLREEDGQALTGRAGKIGLPLPLTLPKARGSAVPGTGGGDPSSSLARPVSDQEMCPGVGTLGEEGRATAVFPHPPASPPDHSVSPLQKRTHPVTPAATCPALLSRSRPRTPWDRLQGQPQGAVTGMRELALGRPSWIPLWDQLAGGGLLKRKGWSEQRSRGQVEGLMRPLVRPPF